MFQPIQIAAINALNEEQRCVHETAEIYRNRRDTLINGLKRVGWEIEKPKGSMFVWAEIPKPYKKMGSVEFTKLLLREHVDGLDEKGIDMLRTIQRSVGKMEALINDLLAFSRSGRKQLNLARVDMADLARATFEDLKETFSDRTVKFDLGAVPPAHADRSLVRQVFANLIANAVKFTKHREVATIEVKGWTEGGSATYSVKDNGVGFDMQSAGRLFNVFERLHRGEEFEGTGLGLSIVQRIVARHGGRTWATTTFDFRIYPGVSYSPLSKRRLSSVLTPITLVPS